MAIEDAIARLTAAIERNQEGPAVEEIIRQRDYWQKEAATFKRRSEMYQGWHEEAGRQNVRLGRVISALRGTITRMRKAARPA